MIGLVPVLHKHEREKHGRRGCYRGLFCRCPVEVIPCWDSAKSDSGEPEAQPDLLWSGCGRADTGRRECRLELGQQLICRDIGGGRRRGHVVVAGLQGRGKEMLR